MEEVHSRLESREPRTIKIRITNEQQYEEMTLLLSEYGVGKNIVKKLAEGEQKYSTPIMQRMAGYLETKKIPVETVIKLDEFSRNVSKTLLIKVVIPLHQHEYTYGNIEEVNAVSIAKVFSRYGLKPTRNESTVWGLRGNSHSNEIGAQVFTVTLTDTKQLEMIFNILRSGSGWRIEAY